MSVEVVNQGNGMLKLDGANPIYLFHVDGTCSAKDETAESNVKYWQGGGGNEMSPQDDMTKYESTATDVKACLVAFTNGLLFLELLEKGENIQHPGIWEGVVSMWKPVYSWALYFFQSSNILSGNASAVQEENVASVTMLLAQMSAHADISRVIISNAVFLETRQPTNFEYLMHALTSFPAFSEASDDVHNDLVRWAMAHAIKLEPDLDMDGPIAKHWFRLKERYDIEHNKGLRLCNNNKALNMFESVVSQNVALNLPDGAVVAGFHFIAPNNARDSTGLEITGKHVRTYKRVQRVVGGMHDTCARDCHLQGEWTKIKVRQNLRHLVTMRKADILKNPAAENYPTAIAVNFCHEDGVRISCIAKDEIRARTMFTLNREGSILLKIDANLEKIMLNVKPINLARFGKCLRSLVVMRKASKIVLGAMQLSMSRIAAATSPSPGFLISNAANIEAMSSHMDDTDRVRQGFAWNVIRKTVYPWREWGKNMLGARTGESTGSGPPGTVDEENGTFAEREQGADELMMQIPGQVESIPDILTEHSQPGHSLAKCNNPDAHIIQLPLHLCLHHQQNGGIPVDLRLSQVLFCYPYDCNPEKGAHDRRNFVSVDVANQGNGMFRLEHINPSYPFHMDGTYSTKDEIAESNVRYWWGGRGNEMNSQGDMLFNRDSCRLLRYFMMMVKGKEDTACATETWGTVWRSHEPGTEKIYTYSAFRRQSRESMLRQKAVQALPHSAITYINAKHDAKGDMLNLIALSEIPDPPLEQVLVVGVVVPHVYGDGGVHQPYCAAAHREYGRVLVTGRMCRSKRLQAWDERATHELYRPQVGEQRHDITKVLGASYFSIVPTTVKGQSLDLGSSWGNLVKQNIYELPGAIRELSVEKASSRVEGADKVAATTSPLSIGGHLLAVSRLYCLAFIAITVFVVSPFGNIRNWATNCGCRAAYVGRIACYQARTMTDVSSPIVAASHYGYRNTVLTAQRTSDCRNSLPLSCDVYRGQWSPCGLASRDGDSLVFLVSKFLFTGCRILTKAVQMVCYAGYSGCIMGAEGDLSFTPDSSSADFNYEGPLHSCDLYYHTHGPIFPIDPDVENASKTDHSDVDALAFGISILEHDKSCVATGMKPSSCRTAHLIPQSQGNQYIKAFTQGQGGDIFNDIDDPQNGCVPRPTCCHSPAQTPNFIMKTTDALQGAALDDALWTLHVFDDVTTEDSEHNVVPAGQAIRVPEDRDTLPPHCEINWSNSFYPEVQQSCDEVKYKAMIDSDNRVRQVDVFDALLMLQEMAARNAAHNAPLCESQSAQKDNDDVQEKGIFYPFRSFIFKKLKKDDHFGTNNTTVRHSIQTFLSAAMGGIVGDGR
ncbi:hypothetical protein EV421DRAFT_2017567 [Armillaria borealis]|uniref:Uncharacterized protein n=1 Tax=Armillaria borealis TaxID=47425 RepID=A0AA39JTS5_9AGAR|nr:hypothetical protein EV421DRAFT_2017567 [Armillaria borealis]